MRVRYRIFTFRKGRYGDWIARWGRDIVVAAPCLAAKLDQEGGGRATCWPVYQGPGKSPAYVAYAVCVSCLKPKALGLCTCKPRPKPGTFEEVLAIFPEHGQVPPEDDLSLSREDYARQIVVGRDLLDDDDLKEVHRILEVERRPAEEVARAIETRVICRFVHRRRRRLFREIYRPLALEIMRELGIPAEPQQPEPGPWERPEYVDTGRVQEDYVVNWPIGGLSPGDNFQGWTDWYESGKCGPSPGSLSLRPMWKRVEYKVLYCPRHKGEFTCWCPGCYRERLGLMEAALAKIRLVNIQEDLDHLAWHLADGTIGEARRRAEEWVAREESWRRREWLRRV